MGTLAVSHADWSIVTSDNPRYEDPERILSEIQDGIPADSSNYEIIVDRREAISRALEMVQPGDLVLVAGRGHETYQEVEGRKIPFDDREVVKEVVL
jgi:UDP-N-acetylmuramoyl-L-alanyl-D-glutamate--2,6-diaminopimelate ligase